MNKVILTLASILFLSTPAFSTTVAFDGRSISADSRMTVQNLATGEEFSLDTCPKLFYVKGYIVGAAGDVDAIYQFLNWLQTGRDYPFAGGGINIIVVSKAGAFLYDNTGKVGKIHPPFAIGSGGEVALMYMQAGRSTQEAVQEASKRDVHTGGCINTIVIQN